MCVPRRGAQPGTQGDAGDYIGFPGVFRDRRRWWGLQAMMWTARVMTHDGCL